MGKCLVWEWFPHTCLDSSVRGKYKIKFPKAGNGHVFFLNEWVRFARRADKAVALGYHYYK